MNQIPIQPWILGAFHVDQKVANGFTGMIIATREHGEVLGTWRLLRLLSA
jgi:hypothetical protein